VHRVQGENCGDKCAAPNRASQSSEKAKEEECISDVEEEINQMMAGGFEAENLAIEHVREPCERMPVGGMGLGERPT